jgi:hypothetical protein
MVPMRGNLGRQLQLLLATAVQLKCLERMLDENGPKDAHGGLAGYSQPSCRSSRSPGGGSSRCRAMCGESV